MAESKVIFIKAFFLFFLMLFIAPKTYATETKSYLVTEYREITKEPYLDKVIYYKYVSFPWKSGKVVLSGSPDGTKPVNIGWKIEILNARDQSRMFSFNNTDQIYTCVEKEMPPLNITHLLSEGSNTLFIRFVRPCFVAYKMQDIGPMYVVHFDDYEISDDPFLDLPWDYAGDGRIFGDVAIRMSSYFDHEYPLLSTKLKEIGEVASSMVVFNNSERSQKYYSSHDGYDWARDAGAILDDLVLASAPGWATYHYNKFIGNAIFIDHENGYQTRYYHLDPDGLVTKSSNKAWVNDRQQIGKVGFTGNVSPTGSKGAHIHFMVIKDKDGNGSFDDNIPDGIIDPFGWQAGGPDPWPAYSFTYGGSERTGIKSTYLWKKSLKNMPQTLSKDGSKIRNNGSNTTFDFPMQIVSHDAIFDSIAGPPITKPTINGIIEESFASVGNTVSAIVRDGFDNIISSFPKKFTLLFSFQDQDVERIDPTSLSIYSSSDEGATWQKEETVLDMTKKQATAKLDHMTEFALIGKRLDSEAPLTSIAISGTKEGEYYTSPVLFSLTASDGPTGTSLGVSYTGYSINDAVWTEYTEPVTIAYEGEHTIEFYSEDGDGNGETANQAIFTIDFTPPTPTSEPTQTSTPTPTPTITPTPTPTTLQQDLMEEQTPTPTSISSTTPTHTITTTPSTTPTTSSLIIGTTVSTNSPTPTASPTKQPFTSTPRKVANIPPTLILEPESQGEVKSAFAAEAGNETAPPEDNTYPSLSLKNLFIMIMVGITAIILVWYHATRRKEIAT